MQLSQSDARHLHRLLGWIACEIGQAPDELVTTVRAIASKLNEPIEQEGKARMVQAHAEACNVPAYVRSAVKALRKRLSAADRDATWEPQFDACVSEQESLAVAFSAEISNGHGVDAVRLLEMSEALYTAERDGHQRAALERHAELFGHI